MPQTNGIDAVQGRFSRAMKNSKNVQENAELSRIPFPYSREGVRKRIECSSGYDDLLLTEEYSMLIDFGFDKGFLTQEEATGAKNHKTGRIAELKKSGKFDAVMRNVKPNIEIFDPRMNGESRTETQSTPATTEISPKQIGAFWVIAVVGMLLVFLLPVSISIAKAFRQGLSGDRNRR